MTTPSDVGRLSRVAAETCERATGQLLTVPDTDAWPQEVISEDAFRRLVSSAYVWLHEDWALHTSFFRNSAAAAVGQTTHQLRLADGNVTVLRTSHEHRLDPSVPRDARTLRDAASWMRNGCGSERPTTEAEWRRCADTLLGELERATREFIGIARALEADSDLAAQWDACFAATEIDLVALREEVAGDLGLVVRGGDANYLDRMIDRRWQRAVGRSSIATPERARIVVLQELVAWSTPPLPVALDELLDRLDIEPGRQLLGAVRLVAAISDAAVYEGPDELLRLVEEVWSRLPSRA